MFCIILSHTKRRLEERAMAGGDSLPWHLPIGLPVAASKDVEKWKPNALCACVSFILAEVQNESPNESVFKQWSHDVHSSVFELRFSLVSWVLSTLPYWPFICLIFWLQETVSFPHAYARNSTHIRHQSDRIIFSCSSPTDWERGQGDLKGKNRKRDKQTKRAKKCLGTLHAKASSSAGGAAGTRQITRHQKR